MNRWKEKRESLDEGTPSKKVKKPNLRRRLIIVNEDDEAKISETRNNDDMRLEDIGHSFDANPSMTTSVIQVTSSVPPISFSVPTSA